MSKQEMEQLVAEYGDDLYRFCIHLTGNPDLADDLYQDTFVKMVQMRHRLERSGNVKSYLMGVAVNLWRNNIRKENGRMRIAPQADFEVSEGQAADETQEPLNKVLKEERNRALSQAVGMLPENLRMVVLLHYSAECSARDISKILHIPRGTVLSRLSVARKRLKERLEEMEYAERDS